MKVTEIFFSSKSLDCIAALIRCMTSSSNTRHILSLRKCKRILGQLISSILGDGTKPTVMIIRNLDA